MWCKFFKLFGILVCFYFPGFAQSNVTLEWDNDTMWYVNPNYNPDKIESTKYELTLTLPKWEACNYAKAELIWGDNGDVVDSGDSWNPSINAFTKTHTYLKPGVYTMKIKLYTNAGDPLPDRTIYKKFMNRGLEVEFKIEQANGRCMEWGGDTVLIYLTNTDNPPETEYEIIVDSKAKGIDGVDSLCKMDGENWPDSANIIFVEPTGVHGATISISMSYEKKGIKFKGESIDTKKIYIYRKPDIRRIYQFVDTISIDDDPTQLNFELCTPNATGLTMNKDILKKFQYWNIGISDPSPYYESLNDKNDFQIDYFWTDSIQEDDKTIWQEVTTDSRYVDTLADLTFKKAGYYKVRIKASNFCSEEIDSLWTDSVKNDPDKKRYFQVYDASGDKMYCRNDTLCFSNHIITIVDTNVRHSYDAVPEYSIEIDPIMNDGEEVPSVVFTSRITKYKNGEATEYTEGMSKTDKGCDSTVISIDISRAGRYWLTVKRSSACGELSRRFSIVIADVPKLKGGDAPVGVAVDLMNAGLQFKNTYLWICDKFNYHLSESDAFIDSVYLKLDSVMFSLQKGAVIDTIYNYESTDFLFDSVGNKPNYIIVKAKNACGWGYVDNALFYTRVQPDVKLYRDNMIDNDSLCLKFDYPYALKGELPENFSVDLSVAGSYKSYINIDKRGYDGGTTGLKDEFTVSYPYPGNYNETYKIVNTDQEECFQQIDEELDIIISPSRMIFEDSIRYCANLNILNTEDLFSPDDKNFKWAQWGWNKTQSDDRFPVFNLKSIPGEQDTLYSDIHNSIGCFIKDTIIFTAKNELSLVLSDSIPYCLPGTIQNYQDYLGDINPLTMAGAVLKVYREKKEDASLLYHLAEGVEKVKRNLTLTDFTVDSVHLIYELYNDQVDEAFVGTCHSLDTMKLQLFRPKLKVTRRDTLDDPWADYSFAHLQDALDMADLNPDKFEWHLPSNGTGSFTTGGLFTANYHLSDADKELDSLVFKLTAKTICGAELKDSLILYLSHVKLKAYKDIICSNTEDYPLWNKISSQYVDTTSVEWNICHPSIHKGTLSVTGGGIIKGKNVYYTPSATGAVGDDSIRIALKAYYYLGGRTAEDTIVLKVNPAPKLRIKEDTLIACDNEIDIETIKSDYLETAHCGDLAGGGYVAGNNGSWKNETVFQFTEDLFNWSDDLWRKVEIKAEGLPGCAAATDTVTFLNLVYAKVNFKRPLEEMCTQDIVRLDTLYNPEGFDKYTLLKWALKEEPGAQNGGFDNDTIYYEAFTPEDHIQEIRVTTSKSYTCYNGVVKNEALRVTGRKLPVIVHREPNFNWVHKVDTICRSEIKLDIKRNWANVAASEYPNYTDSLVVNGRKFTSDLLNYPIAGEGKADTLVLTVSQGRCTKWGKRSDTLFLYHLPSMIGGTFQVPAVCENGKVEVDLSLLQINSLAKSFSWTAKGGVLDHSMYYTPNGYGQGTGSVTLHVQPPKGCTMDTLRQEFDIFRLPRLDLKDDTICRLTGQSVTIPLHLTSEEHQSNVGQVEWYRVGEESNVLYTTSGTAPIVYPILKADSIRGYVHLVAKAQTMTPCNSYVYDTVHIFLQHEPKIGLPIQPILACQGVGIDLENELVITDFSSLIWEKVTAFGPLNGSVYLPGESWGAATFKVHALGKHGCPQKSKEFSVQVQHAPQPDINVITSPLCQNDTIHLEVAIPEMSVVADQYEWKFGDGNIGLGKEVKHIYALPQDDYKITLTAKYGTCERVRDKHITIWEKPKAIFTPKHQIAIGEPVTFNSLSLPDGVDCKWFFVTGNEGSAIGNPCVHVFGGMTGERKVLLQVTTEQGCKDTVSHSVMAVTPPIADFKLKVDSCSGVVEIANLSTQNHAEVMWNFGNSTANSTDWNPQPQTYARIFDDTTYQITLTLSNAADTVSVTRMVTLVSKLKAGVELYPLSDECNKLDKQIHILTLGKADTSHVWWGDGSTDSWTRDEQIMLLRHRYENESTGTKFFPLRLIAINKCESDTTLPLAVPVLPVTLQAKVSLDTNYKNECFGVDRGFENKSFGFSQNGYTCEWQFGVGEDLITDNSAEVVHLFEKPGSYLVTLKVRDNCNEDVDSIKIQVHGNDSLDFAFDDHPHCSDKEIGMKLIQHGDKPFSNFRWRFPDGRVRNESETTYSFDEAGNFIVSLTATADGCVSTTQRMLKVHESPIPLISVTDNVMTGCQPFEVNFHGRNGNNQEVKALWDFKDNASSDKLDITKTFAKEGLYNVSFRLETANGCVDSSILPITVLYTPEVDMKLSEHLFCTEKGDFELNCLNTSANIEDCAFEWWRGDELISMQNNQFDLNFENTFGAIGIKLKAIHKQTRCFSEKTDTVMSSHLVKAALQVEPLSVCEGALVNFVNSTAYADQVKLDFGDGVFADEAGDLEHIYERSGTYLVDMWVANVDGCQDSVTLPLTVHALPVVDFIWDKDNSVTGLSDTIKLPDVDNGGIRFENKSWFADNNGHQSNLTYEWNFGDGSEISTIVSPTHFYPNNGTYEVWLRAQTEAGCRDSISDFVNIAAVKGLFIPTAFVPAAADDGVRLFQPKGIGLHSYIIRVYEEGGTCVWKSDKLINGKPAEAWDGTFNGQPLPKGVYTWKISAVFIDNSIWNKDGGQGSVILIR